MTQDHSLPGLIKGIWIVNALVILGMGSAFALSRVDHGPESIAASPLPTASLAVTPVPNALAEVPQLTSHHIDTRSPTPTRARTLRATGTPSPTDVPTRGPYATDTRWPTLTRTPTITPIATCTPARGAGGTVSFGVVETPTRPQGRCRLLPTPTPTNETVLGYSMAGRTIELFTFGNGETGRLIVGGIHGGNEGNTVLLAYELIEYVAAHPEMIPKHVTLYIVPNLNPDGYARGRTLDGRVNDNGVDLNRNWPWKWQADWDRGGCWNYLPTTSGTWALSEPETRWLYRFIINHPEVDALISYHAAALGIFAGGVPDFRPSINLSKTLAGVSEYQYPPVDTGCEMHGDLTDWAATQNIAAVDIELHNFRHIDWEENLAILKAFLQFRRGVPLPPEHP
jgi:predicted deacylase